MKQEEHNSPLMTDSDVANIEPVEQLLHRCLSIGDYAHSGHYTTLRKLLNYCVLRPTQPPTLSCAENE